MLALLCGVAGPAVTLAQTPARPPTFGTGVEIINLNLSVTDPTNAFVTDLEAGDFAVYEDGIPQELSLFTHEDLPISLVLMMDGSASMEDKRKAAQEAALRLARTLRHQDVAQVVQFNERATVLQPFMHDAAAIEA